MRSISRRVFTNTGLAVLCVTVTGCESRERPVTESATVGSKKVALVSFVLESNGMAPPTGKDTFEDNIYLLRDEFAARLGTDVGIGGFLGGALSIGEAWDTAPVLLADGDARGPITDAFLAEVIAAIRDGLEATGPHDGVYVLDHGGAVGVSELDPDGAVLEAVRESVGPDIPVVANHDLHGHISTRMLGACDLNIAHRENPHTDGEARGVLAGTLLNRLMAGSFHPVTAFVRAPMVCPQVTQLTAAGKPLGDILAYGETLRTPAVVDISVLPGYSLTDTDKQGMAILVTTDDDAETAQRVALEIGRYAWEQRRRFVPTLTPIDTAVEMMAATERPVMFADVGDNPGGGASGNNLAVLRAIWGAGLDNIAAGTFYDPETVEAAVRAGVGQSVDLELRGEQSRHPCTARVLGLSADGRYFAEAGIDKGSYASIGPSCALDIDGVHLIATAVHAQILDEGAFDMLGLDARDYRAIVLKARGHFRAAFDFVEERDIYELDSPGLTPQNLRRVDWRHLPRPVYPLDEAMTWAPEVLMLRRPHRSAA